MLLFFGDKETVLSTPTGLRRAVLLEVSPGTNVGGISTYIWWPEFGESNIAHQRLS